ncbi:hypothetical protein ASPCADRAFT_133360 [Aspergillus carbonarius ITEM 5010]|uniref:Transcriptional coactivator p15 (PC4) C-terminal domain-containing protein n=1 Tax=Aspergillus carbonarius (strain ITEM 5010) TaxID=602072 RepID=A0A1R3RCX7_ASPC5|nr:hypothetical protein ASPCADRAFT_210182 [Aspergillus carbonarius ITEM 5010]OOF92333.1 hypothetical protein ASPCADRAFT_133360 [Aspergillus carbonarius ITEM 5010]
MPLRTKKRSPDAEGDLVIDNGHSSKRTKTKASQAKPYVKEGETDSNGDRYWEISKARRVTISSFRGKTMISIREYYEKDGQELPGKKGIALPVEQFSSLVSLLPDIESALQASGESISRPNYASGSEMIVDEAGEDCESGDLLDAGDSRKNIEVTSEDDSDE